MDGNRNITTELMSLFSNGIEAQRQEWQEKNSMSSLINHFQIRSVIYEMKRERRINDAAIWQKKWQQERHNNGSVAARLAAQGQFWGSRGASSDWLVCLPWLGAVGSSTLLPNATIDQRWLRHKTLMDDAACDTNITPALPLWLLIAHEVDWWPLSSE